MAKRPKWAQRYVSADQVKAQLDFYRDHTKPITFNEPFIADDIESQLIRDSRITNDHIED